jgi:hypothetical protein
MKIDNNNNNNNKKNVIIFYQLGVQKSFVNHRIIQRHGVLACISVIGLRKLFTTVSIVLSILLIRKASITV